MIKMGRVIISDHLEPRVWAHIGFPLFSLATLLEVWISLKLIGLKLYGLVLVLVGQAHNYTHQTCQSSV